MVRNNAFCSLFSNGSLTEETKVRRFEVNANQKANSIRFGNGNCRGTMLNIIRYDSTVYFSDAFSTSCVWESSKTQKENSGISILSPSFQTQKNLDNLLYLSLICRGIMKVSAAESSVPDPVILQILLPYSQDPRRWRHANQCQANVLMPQERDK